MSLLVKTRIYQWPISDRRLVNMHGLREMRTIGDDPAFVRVLDDAGTDALLVGDSLGSLAQRTNREGLLSCNQDRRGIQVYRFSRYSFD